MMLVAFAVRCDSGMVKTPKLSTGDWLIVEIEPPESSTAKEITSFSIEIRDARRGNDGRSDTS